eukprot:16133-Heterococcus_DN1.PRE.1
MPTWFWSCAALFVSILRSCNSYVPSLSSSWRPGSRSASAAAGARQRSSLQVGGSWAETAHANFTANAQRGLLNLLGSASTLLDTPTESRRRVNVAHLPGAALHIPQPLLHPGHAALQHGLRRLQQLHPQQQQQQQVPKPPAFESRTLGSFEKLLAKEREGTSVLSTPHVWVAVVAGDVTPAALHAGVVALLSRHPMLRACIKGTGRPAGVVMETIRIDPEDEDPL